MHQLKVELNLEKLADRRVKLCSKFANSSLENNKLNDLIQINSKEHKIQTRNYEKYKVTFANNERLRKSSIVYFQNLLNRENKEKKLNTKTVKRKRKPG